ncbi:hypothetical protein G6F21_014466 [Rhizopus arrhizus]|nr:hypothetical protein G6F21_014466 [Rhizopus arrhizus]
MHFGVGRHFDVEPVAGLFTDERDQFVGVAQFARIAAHARRQAWRMSRRSWRVAPTHDKWGAASQPRLRSVRTASAVPARVEPPAPKVTLTYLGWIASICLAARTSRS